jgi:hypothetical protein
VIVLHLASDLRIDDSKDTGLEVKFKARSLANGTEDVVLRFGLPEEQMQQRLTNLFNELEAADVLDDLLEEKELGRTRQLVAAFRALETWHDLLHEGAFRLCGHEPCRTFQRDVDAVNMGMSIFSDSPERHLPEEMFSPV